MSTRNHVAQLTVPANGTGRTMDRPERNPNSKFAPPFLHTLEESVSLSEAEEARPCVPPNAMDARGGQKRSAERPNCAAKYASSDPQVREQSTFLNSSNTKSNPQPSSFVEPPVGRPLRGMSPVDELLTKAPDPLPPKRVKIAKGRKDVRKLAHSVIEPEDGDSSAKRAVLSSGSTRRAKIRSPQDSMRRGRPMNNTAFSSVYRNRSLLAKSKDSVILELVEESTITDYWQKKEEVEDKYRKMLGALELEEATEIKHRTSKLLKQLHQATPQIVVETIAGVKEEYEITRSLLLKQKVVEEEEAVSQYEKMVSGLPIH